MRRKNGQGALGRGVCLKANGKLKLSRASFNENILNLIVTKHFI